MYDSLYEDTVVCMIPYMKTCSVYDSLYEDTVVCMIPYMKTL